MATQIFFWNVHPDPWGRCTHFDVRIFSLFDLFGLVPPTTKKNVRALKTPGRQFQEVEIIWGIKASWTTEIGAAGAIHDVHGVYLAEVYGNLGTCQAGDCV